MALGGTGVFQRAVTAGPHAPAEQHLEGSNTSIRGIDWPSGQAVRHGLDTGRALRQLSLAEWQAIIPGLDFVIVENTFAKVGPQAECLNRLPADCQPLVGSGLG